MSDYFDYIRIAGLPGNYPGVEVFQGIGSISRFNTETEGKLEAYVSDIIAWFALAVQSLQTGIRQFNAGDPVTVDEPESPPELDVSIAFDWGAAVDVVLWIAKIVFKVALWWAYNWFVERIRRLKDGKPAEISEEIVKAIEDLALVDAIIDFGGFKVHIVGKALKK